MGHSMASDFLEPGQEGILGYNVRAMMYVPPIVRMFVVEGTTFFAGHGNETFGYAVKGDPDGPIFDFFELRSHWNPYVDMP